MDHWNFGKYIASDTLEIPHSILAEMIASLEHVFPEEGCGLLAGKGERVSHIWPVTNILHEKTRFLMDAQEQLNAFIEMDEKEMDLLAVYHSHPEGKSTPSIQDLKEFHYPDVVSLIGSRDETQWVFEGFNIHGYSFRKVVLRWVK